jgi:hypothetical protein
MKSKAILKKLSQSFILMSTLCLLSVVMMAFANPQSVMDLVQVNLTNADAFSSIRGIYGGAGLAISISLLYLMIKDPRKALFFLCMLWGFYALSRIITIFAEGALGDFGKQWLVIETMFFLVALTLLMAGRNNTEPETIKE